ncbi:MAG TPA: FAD-dependent oxidoreductase, partial [Myxococcota bacterium]|nr:FAD-dependent oxidoreductase [Myxococcota bacterium]
MHYVNPLLVAALALGPACTRPKAPSTERVLIVGGGIAGLVTAYGLQRAGISSRVLEERPVWGGRVATADYGNGQTAEYGMQEVWQDSPLLDIARALHVPVDGPGETPFSSVVLEGRVRPFVQSDVRAYWDSLFGAEERARLEAFLARASVLYASAQRQGLQDPNVAALQDMSLAQWVAQSGLGPPASVWLRLTLECELAYDWTGISALEALMEMHMFLDGGLPAWHITGGNSRLIEALVERLGDHASLGV